MQNKSGPNALAWTVCLVGIGSMIVAAPACFSTTGASSEKASDASAQTTVGDGGAFCTGPATEALIDDMSGSAISFAPPSCGTKGAWTLDLSSGSSLTSPEIAVESDAAEILTCGSLCESLYSPLPASLPAGAGTGAGSDGAPGARALCIAGALNTQPYATAGMTLEFGFSGTVPRSGPTYIGGSSSDGTTIPPPALIDASRYSGIQFWLWVSPDTVAGVTSTLEVPLIDENELQGGGVCVADAPQTALATACGQASAAINGSVVDQAQSAGTLVGADGGVLSGFTGGWQLVEIPWSNFLTNPGYGGLNESSVDPTTLAFLSIIVQQGASPTSPVSFDFCVAELAFYL